MLPSSGTVSPVVLSSLFNSRTNSYKFLWFKGILNILLRGSYSEMEISYADIVKEMLVLAWFPGRYHHLSFGCWDKMSQYLDSIDQVMERGVSEREVRRAVDKVFSDDILKQLTRYVPYRVLTPWFKNELYGVENDAERHARTEKLANLEFHDRVPLYRLKSQSIVIHDLWSDYLKNNHSIVLAWVDWHWCNHLQDKNPSIPSISKKINIPADRENLSVARKLWSEYVRSRSPRCIYSGIKLDNLSFSLDHFIPWSYVAHNEIWNLIPVPICPNVNSSKGNCLPSNDYMDVFIDLQFDMLVFQSETIKNIKQWRNFIAPYWDLFRIKEEDILNRDKFSRIMKMVVVQYLESARRLGFTAGWVFQDCTGDE
ncbi:MAG: hypothetical protein K6L73_06405 [Cellvibrionaceae bacterium]